MMQQLDSIASVLFWMMLIFGLGLVGRYLARCFNQPAVLGELLMGVVLGNLCYFFMIPHLIILRESATVFLAMQKVLAGWSLPNALHFVLPDGAQVSRLLTVLQAPDAFDLLQVAQVVDTFSRLGVIFLLFMVGLESSVTDIKQTGRDALSVALIGVICPVLLGYAVMYCLMPAVGFKTNLFVAATLSATSVGITARVLNELKKMRTREAKTILGAAIIDDILGLLILAVVSNIVVSGAVDAGVIAQILALAVGYFVLVLSLGPWVLRLLVRCCYFLDLWEKKLVVAFLFLMLLSWLATCAQLASIIGAFMAGLLIEDHYFEPHTSTKRVVIHELIAPLEALLAPLFFMLIGMQVKCELFFDWHVLLIAAALITAAVIGKLASGIGVSGKVDRVLIGVGMLPRGEVGLVFAAIGRTLGVLSDQLFSAIILMVIVTTCIAPSWIKRRFNRQTKSALCC
jgi:Kef-type K+ transport system membrane component KefB